MQSPGEAGVRTAGVVRPVSGLHWHACHSSSIRQTMRAMGSCSPAPARSRLRHLQQKGWITWRKVRRALFSY
ncbi:hypothetical protein [Synechococcus sp. M16CYN]|uniref:LexA family protein n=1 Tax=Synechococcus sp. M16CYN TaxID=3103139 RepID=UPI003340CC6B